MSKKILITATTVLLTAACWWLYTIKKDHMPHALNADATTLVVGTNVGYPPFIFTDETGAQVGFDVDVARALGAKLQRKVVIKDMAFDALLLALKSGAVDMLIGGLSLTAARKKTGLLIPYYGDRVTHAACFYARTSPYANYTLAECDAHELTVCTQAGSLFEELLAAYPRIQVKTLPDIADIFLEVTKGNSDLGLLDTDSVRALVKSSDQLAAHTITLDPETQIDGFGIGVTPKDAELRAQLEQAVAELRADGTIQTLASHWFGA